MQVLSKASSTSNCKIGNHLPPRDTIGALFRDYGEAYIERYRPNLQTIKLIRSIRVCRTPSLGGHKIVCLGCGDVHFQYHSCGNNQCPQCQSIKRVQWQDRLSAKMLAVPYVHTTFTMPHELNGLARRNPKLIYGLLLASSWKTIDKLCKDKSNLGAKPGMTAVLHTWGSDLKFHVHAHCLITFGGLSSEVQPRWKWPKRKDKLAKYRKMCATFREVFLKGLQQLFDKEQLVYHRTYEEIEKELGSKRWVVHNTHPTANTKVIEEYLSRYICRIGITNNRLTYDANGKNVQIKYNDYKKQEKGQPAPKAVRNLDPLLALQMILQHQVPRYFQRVRHRGLHAAVTYRKIKDKLPNNLRRNGNTVRTVIQILKELLKKQPYVCAQCGGFDFEEIVLPNDEQYIWQFINKKKRGPPALRAGDIKVIDKKNP